MRPRVFLGLIVAASLLGCSSGTSPPDEDVIWVNFDGRECTVNGPATVPAASVIAVVLTNDSDIAASVTVARLIPHGVTGVERTFEDFAELQRLAGGVLYEDGANVAEHPMNWLWEERSSFERNVNWPARLELAENQTARAYELVNQMGDDIIFVSVDGTFDSERIFTPAYHWFCAPLEVTAIDF